MMCKVSCLSAWASVAAASCCVAAEHPVIAVDVGHSRLHPGAISARGQPEFEFNLALARVIEQALSSRHARTILIGADGTMGELRARTAQADVSRSTFFLSVHHDSVQPGYLEAWQWRGSGRLHSDRFSGFSLFVSRKNRHPDASLACARAIGSSLIKAGYAPSAHHAEKIPGESREWADLDAGVYYFDDLVVLKTATTPAVLMEAGVIVNRTEEAALQHPRTRRNMAFAVAAGLADCGAIR